MTRPQWLALGLVVGKPWLTVKDGDPAAYQIMRRHYSFHEYKDNRRKVGRNRHLFVGPGDKMVLVTPEYDALFVWRKFKDDSGQAGVNCAVFRNEGTRLSSELILAAEELAALRWPGERLYTYVRADAVRSVNPGYCFKRAGWLVCGRTKVNDLIILEKSA